MQDSDKINTFRRSILTLLAAGSASKVLALPNIADSDLVMELLAKDLRSGGYLIGRTQRDTVVKWDGKAVTVSNNGLFICGIPRSRSGSVSLDLSRQENKKQFSIVVAKRSFQSQIVNGLPRELVDLFEGEMPDEDTEDELAKSINIQKVNFRDRLLRENAVKVAAFKKHVESQGFTQKMVRPVPGRVSSQWGAERRKNYLNGTSKVSIHYGVDISAPQGTPVKSPVDGIVLLAENDYFYEGNFVVLGHGGGLITAYLHLNSLNVAEGKNVSQGQIIGKVGSTGSATGNHLCWRAKVGDTQIDPGLLAQLY